VDLDDGFRLNEAIRAIGIRHRALAGSLLLPLGLYPGQEVLLLELRDGSRTQAQLAVASGCEPPTITHSVRKLEAAGLVTRRPSPDDARLMIVELGDQGRMLLPRLVAAWQHVAEQTVAGLTDTPLDALLPMTVDLANSLRGASTRGPAG
jgi:DNA-binding MarR family transcriptional regulator